MPRHIIFGAAGSGKTYHLIKTIEELLDQGVSPLDICFTTYTKAAAQEAIERVMKKFNLEKRDLPLFGTIHSLCYKNFCRDKKVITEKQKKEFFRINNIDYDTIRNDEDFLTGEHQTKTAGNLILSFYDTIRMNLCKNIHDIKNEAALKSLYANLKDPGMDFSVIFVNTFKPFDILQEYEKFKEARGVIDFVDMLLIAYKNNFIIKSDILIVDEFQDLSPLQYAIYQLWCIGKKDVYISGDDSQCLTAGTKVETSNGKINIEKLKSGDEVISNFAGGYNYSTKIKNIFKKKIDEEIIKIRTKKHKEIYATKDHHFFVNWDLKRNLGYYVYLMEDKHLGFRIGITKNPVIRKRCEPCIEAIYPIAFFKKENDARFFEEYCSLKYQIPTQVFNYRAGMPKEYISKLFKSFNTKENIKTLLNDVDRDLETTVWIKAVTRARSNRRVINLCCLYYRDNRRNKKFKPNYLVYYQQGKNRKDSQKNRLRLEFTDYNQAKKKAEELAKKYNAEILERWSLLKNTTHGKFLKVRARNLIEGMNIPIFNSKTKKFEKDKIVKIERVKQKTEVYDLEIEGTHNFIANDICVSNCIYQFNGASSDYLLTERKNLNKANGDKEIILPRTYRMRDKINKYCADYIENNIRKEKHVKKDMIANQEGGEIVTEDIDGYLDKTLDFIRPGKFTFVLFRTNYYKKIFIDEVLIPNGRVYYEIRGRSIWNTNSITLFNGIINLVEKKPLDALQTQALFDAVPFKLGLLKRGAKSKFKRMDKKEEYDLSDLLAVGFNVQLFNFLSYDKIYDILDLSDSLRTAFKEAKKEYVQTPIHLRIGTIHSSKGKESDDVIIFKDVSKKIVKEASKNQDNFESEIRVFYVGQSRARERLVILRGGFKKSDRSIIP